MSGAAVNGKRQAGKITAAIVLSFVFAVLLFVYIRLVETADEGVLSLSGEDIKAIFLNVKFYALWALVSAFAVLLARFGKRMTDFLYRYRYAICLFIFVICVAFAVSGSSIGCWNHQDYLGGTDSGIIAGVSREIRSDEWFVSTPMAFSQYYNPSGHFSYFSEIVRGTPTDVFLEYGQPVLSAAEIFRPFHWGYLFLPQANGLAFYWCGRLIALFLVSFEMGMLISKKNKTLSLMFALTVLLAPVVQWWFAINGLVEMLIYAQLAVVMLHKYLETDSVKWRSLYAGVILLCAGGYILTMYPSWMVPIGYILLGLIIWVLMEHHRKIHFRKWDILILAVECLCFLGLMYIIFRNSMDTIRAISDTVYPGKRFETGGGHGQNLTNYVSGIWYAMTGTGTEVNVCESAAFIDFFPLCYIIPLWVIFKDRIRDKLLVILLIISVFLEVYVAFGFPGFLAKVTLLSNSQSSRVIAVAGFCNLLLLIRALSLMRTRMHIAGAAAVAAGCTVLCVWTNVAYFPAFYEKQAFIPFTAVIFGAAFLLILLASSQTVKRLLLGVVFIIMLMAGLLVNPVRRGADNIYGSDSVQYMREIVSDDPEALWIVEGMGVPINNLPIMAGAKTVNSTNIYPALDRWRILDPDGEYENVYNRYAHIGIYMTEDADRSFDLTGPDYFWLICSIDDLRALDVEYILTRNDFSAYPESDLELVKEWPMFRVYRIRYQDLN